VTRPKGTLNKEPALKHFSLRIPQEVYDFYKQGGTPSAEMRDVLERYMWEQRSKG